MRKQKGEREGGEMVEERGKGGKKKRNYLQKVSDLAVTFVFCLCRMRPTFVTVYAENGCSVETISVHSNVTLVIASSAGNTVSHVT